MYLSWNEQTITDFSDENINALYNQGYLFTRIGKGIMKQTRSLRINLSKFELSSENRRILKKTNLLTFSFLALPLPNYHWSIGKLAKDFYETKFGPGTFSANKVKEILTDPEKSNFNRLFVYTSNLSPYQGELEGVVEGDEARLAPKDENTNSSVTTDPTQPPLIGEENIVGYAIARETKEFIHYSYPFYDLNPTRYTLNPDTGIGMMLRAILHAKEQGKKYFYLGSAQRPSDTYKLQFAGVEWWDGEMWSVDQDELKKTLVL